MMFANTPIAEAVASGAAGRSPWPLAGVLYSSLGGPLVQWGCLAAAAGVLFLAAIKRSCRPLQASLCVVLGLSVAFRDLANGSLISGSDPAVLIFLWSALIVSLLSERSVIRCGSTLSVLVAWPFLDAAWPPAPAVAMLCLLGCCLDGNGRAAKEIGFSVSASLLAGFLRPESFAELQSTWDALASPPDSLIRYLSGWCTPNFQVRRELILGMLLAVMTFERRPYREALVVLGVVAYAAVSEAGATALPVLCVCSIAAFLSSRLETSRSAIPLLRTERGRIAAACCLLLPATLLIVSREEPRLFEQGARDLMPSLKRFAAERRLEAPDRQVLGDFRMSAAFLDAGVPTWLDRRLLSSPADRNGKAAGDVLHDYEVMVTVADGFEETLDRLGIEAVVFPDETPLLNVLRERPAWEELSRSAPIPILFRGVIREQTVTLMVRRR